MYEITSGGEESERIVLKGSAAQHIDAYAEYYQLVGNTDGGVPLPSRKYEELKRKALQAKENELFVFWRNTNTDMDCRSVGPVSMCLCGHRYREHSWFETESKSVRCRMNQCRCRQFQYIPQHGSRQLHCSCKHPATDHDPVTCLCNRATCRCEGFYATQRCDCGGTFSDHATVFEQKRERVAAGKPVQRPPGAAGPFMGGVTSHLSLLTGTDRQEFERSRRDTRESATSSGRRGA